MKIAKRILCLSLVVLMLLPLLVACGGTKDDPASSTPNHSGVINPGEQTTATGEPRIENGVGIQDFQGRQIRFLGWKQASANEFEVEETDTKTTLKQAVYTRNEVVKASLNVDLKWDYTDGHAGCETDYVAEAEKRINSSQVDVFTPYSRAANILMIQGLTQDLKKVEYIDFTKPWWSAGLVENCVVNGNLYFAGGDISWALMGMTIAFCFNKGILDANSEILDKYDVDTMYQLVDQKKWTLDVMIEMAKGVASGENYGDGFKDGGGTATYGFTAYNVPMDAFYKGCDLDWMTVENGQQKISDDQNSGKVNTVIEKLTTFFQTSAACAGIKSDTTLVYASNNGNQSNPKNLAFTGNRSLFALHSIISITDFNYTNLPFAFGVLPMPMYDANQPAYKTTPDFEYSVIAIPRAAIKVSEVGAVIEVMAHESYYTTAPAYYSETLKKQISDSAEDYAMWETIKNSIEMDGGRLFDWQIAECAVWGNFRNALMTSQLTITANWEKNGGQMIADASKMNSTMKSIEKKFG